MAGVHNAPATGKGAPGRSWELVLRAAGHPLVRLTAAALLQAAVSYLERPGGAAGSRGRPRSGATEPSTCRPNGSGNA
ncbi:hypothetical protein [Streptomyces sp. H27-D2]|uniref:hypothetical protein n=1 Tax=Streptomyces sp. H27-D2 TaxID=3046304 RepID=UPI002DB7062D|nr:hypothetical protein [Streptomyces sp. H27-D2]MEC4015496.1 hypothetical protein [Streptomyces sp. H27-D2]